jgi:hypothetical protein
METEDEVEVKYQCTNCNLDLDEDDKLTTDNGETVCTDCVKICERCESVGQDHDDWCYVDNMQMWCANCTGSYAHWCDDCDNYFTGYTYGAEDTSMTFCERCFESSCSYCEPCDSYYYDGCTYNHDEEDDTRLIHDYSYRPDPIFHSGEDEQTRLYFGIEIETEVRGGNYPERTNAAEYAQLLEDKQLAYLKSDGSLECGFEIVTHPMSHHYFMKENDLMWEVISKLKQDYNMISWGTKTCGLHIHISRNGFSGGSHQHRFLQLVYGNKDFYEVLAGRSSSHWAKFDDVVDQETGKKSFKNKFDRHGSDRYSAVNTNNRNTLEMRIFRGSLNPRFIKSAIDLAHASVEYTRVMSVQQVRDNALSTLKFVEYIESKPDLYQSLNERIVIHKDIIQRIGRREHVSVGSVFTE